MYGFIITNATFISDDLKKQYNDYYEWGGVFWL